MMYVQQVRGRWFVFMGVTDDLREIVAQRELVESGLSREARALDKLAVKAANAFHANLE